MRISTSMIYQNSIDRMNSALSRELEIMMQIGTEKRINRPSDDPAGMATILRNRNTLRTLEQYESNIGLAQGWLNLSDQTLLQVSTILTRLTELATNGSTGTLTDDNRYQISQEVRQLFSQLLTLSNVQFNGNSLYAGQKTDGPAFVESVWMDVRTGDEWMDTSGNWTGTPSTGPDNSNELRIVFNEGARTDYTTLIQITDTGPPPSYRYSTDGAKTWQDGVATEYSYANDEVSPVNEADVYIFTFDNGVQATIGKTGADNNFVANSATDYNDTSGTWMWLRPTAEYVGDDKDHIEVDPVVRQDGTHIPNSILATATGSFQNDVAVRIDAIDSTTNIVTEYSYTLDNGSTWVTGQRPLPGATATEVSLAVPGGILKLDASSGARDLLEGDQFIIRPRTADIAFNTSPSESIVVNGIGKDIFGGIYYDPQQAYLGSDPENDNNDSSLWPRRKRVASVYGSEDNNLFETVGKLVAALETNNQGGVQNALESLKNASNAILNYAATVGARENRLEYSLNTISNLKYSAEDEISRIEDLDATTAMTKLAQSQYAYQAVLKSSSMILQMSLLNYI